MTEAGTSLRVDWLREFIWLIGVLFGVILFWSYSVGNSAGNELACLQLTTGLMRLNDAESIRECARSLESGQIDIGRPDLFLFSLFTSLYVLFTSLLRLVLLATPRPFIDPIVTRRFLGRATVFWTLAFAVYAYATRIAPSTICALVEPAFIDRLGHMVHDQCLVIAAGSSELGLQWTNMSRDNLALANLLLCALLVINCMRLAGKR